MKVKIIATTTKPAARRLTVIGNAAIRRMLCVVMITCIAVRIIPSAIFLQVGAQGKDYRLSQDLSFVTSIKGVTAPHVLKFLANF